LLEVKRKPVVIFGIGLFLASQAFFTIKSFSEAHTTSQNDLATGWVLGKKFAHDPGKTIQLISESYLDEGELYRGVGWSMTSVLFKDIDDSDQELASKKAIELKELIEAYPASVRPQLLEGAEISFGFKATERYNSAFWEKIKPILDKNLQLQ